MEFFFNFLLIVDQVGKIRRLERLKWKLAWNKSFYCWPLEQPQLIKVSPETRDEASNEKSPFYGPNIKNHCESNAHYCILWVEFQSQNTIKGRKNIRRLYDFRTWKNKSNNAFIYELQNTQWNLWKIRMEWN